MDWMCLQQPWHKSCILVASLRPSVQLATMPNNSGNGEVQRMMRDIGDAVDMDYGCDGSGADGDKTDNAFKNDFCFGSADGDGYGSGSYQVVIQDINADRPVLRWVPHKKRKFHGYGILIQLPYVGCAMATNAIKTVAIPF